jgi:DnaJ family protein A protein 2
MADIFDLFTGGAGGGGRGGRGGRERRSEDVVHKLAVSLEELYKGVVKKLSLSRKLPCGGCKGTGSRTGKRYECSPCRGTGVQVQIRPIGPGMVQQIQARCSSCGGQGFSTPPSDRCGGCQGSCLVQERKTFEVPIERGARHGSKVVLRGEAGCTEPGLEPGDVVLVIAQKEHPTFKRLNHNHIDLLVSRRVSLRDALCGCSLRIRHLDGRVIRVTSPPGNVISPGAFKVVQDEGMPIHGRPSQHGNLYIQFDVDFPAEIEAAAAEALRSALPGSAGGSGGGAPGKGPASDAEPSTPAPGGGASSAAAMDADDDEEEPEQCHMRPVADIEEELKHRARLGRSTSGAAYESDSDDEDGMRGPGGQRVQCAHQ